MKKHFSSIFLILIFFMGLSLLLYPAVSNCWNSLHQRRSIVEYDAALQHMSETDYSAYFEAAEDYNRRLQELNAPLTNFERVEGYEETLNIGTGGIMGYITIEKIDVNLPICHGTSEGVLQAAVGHLEGSCLPIGGESTHSVLSAHRGFPSARLFTDLDKIEIGDEFTLTVLDQKLTYQVDQILVVQPQETEPLGVTEGEDYCTLITCTPYGINSHRMLVRGKRIENGAESAIIHVTSDAAQVELSAAAPLLVVSLLAVVLIRPRRRRRSV